MYGTFCELGLMDKHMETYKKTTMILLYAQRWKDLQIPTVEQWTVKLMELVKIVKLTALIKEKSLTNFISTWKTLLDFLDNN